MVVIHGRSGRRWRWMCESGRPHRDDRPPPAGCCADRRAPGQPPTPQIRQFERSTRRPSWATSSRVPRGHCRLQHHAPDRIRSLSRAWPRPARGPSGRCARRTVDRPGDPIRVRVTTIVSLRRHRAAPVTRPRPRRQALPRRATWQGQRCDHKGKGSRITHCIHSERRPSGEHCASYMQHPPARSPYLLFR